MRGFVIMFCTVVCSSAVLHAGSQADAKPDPSANGGLETKKTKPDYPPFDEVIDGLEKIISTTDGSSPLFDLYKDDKTGKLLAARGGSPFLVPGGGSGGESQFNAGGV